MKRFLILFITVSLVVMASVAQTTDPSTEPNDTTKQVVNVGYSSDDADIVKGTVEEVSNEQLNKGLQTTALDALSGKVAGVDISNVGNHTAMVAAVRVRGTSSLLANNNPLVIIDGVICDLTALMSIYPADIMRFAILKDAAEVSQYGSLGSAGVIEVTTKKGRNQQFHISYDGNVGFEHIYNRLKMLDAQQYRQANQALGLGYIDRGYDTDFGRSIERTGLVHTHHLSFGGGTEQANYRASIGIMDHRTVIRTNNYRTYTAKLDLTQHAFNGKLTVDLGVFGSVQKNNELVDKWKLMYSAQAFNPTFPDFPNPDGTYEGIPEAYWIDNPNALLQQKLDIENSHLNAHGKAVLNLGYDTKMSLFLSYSYKTVSNAHFYPTSRLGGGEAYRGHDKNEDLRGHVSVEKAFTFPLHKLSLSAVIEGSKQKNSGFYTTVAELSTNAYGYDKLSAGATRPWGGTDSYYNESRMASWLFRGQYSFLDRYTLTASLRADASSKFGANHRWGYFPSVSAIWAFNKEPWMRSLTFLTDGKLRMGYGRSGSFRGVSAYQSMQLVQPNGVVSLDGNLITTQDIVRNANPDLKWEQKRSFNVGLNLAFWHDRISLNLDYYYSKTTDMLYVYDVPVPPFTYDKLLANLGSMESSGLEIGIGITPLHTKDMELAFNMNWSFQQNKLLSLNGYWNGQYLTTSQETGIASLKGAGYHGSSTVVYQIVGEPLGVFKMYHCEGLTTEADGSHRYKLSAKKQICGQATPKALMGSNITFRYRNYDITMQVNGAFGHKIFNASKLTYMNLNSLPNYNVMEGALEANIRDQVISDYWLERGDYINIDYVTIGWMIPLRSKYVKSLRVSASVNNLATITGYSGLTPMINSTVVNRTLGIDNQNTLPVFRTYSIGLNVKF